MFWENSSSTAHCSRCFVFARRVLYQLLRNETLNFRYYFVGTCRSIPFDMGWCMAVSRILLVYLFMSKMNGNWCFWFQIKYGWRWFFLGSCFFPLEKTWKHKQNAFGICLLINFFSIIQNDKPVTCPELFDAHWSTCIEQLWRKQLCLDCVTFLLIFFLYTNHLPVNFQMQQTNQIKKKQVKIILLMPKYVLVFSSRNRSKYVINRSGVLTRNAI